MSFLNIIILNYPKKNYTSIIAGSFSPFWYTSRKVKNIVMLIPAKNNHNVWAAQTLLRLLLLRIKNVFLTLFSDTYNFGSCLMGSINDIELLYMLSSCTRLIHCFVGFSNRSGSLQLVDLLLIGISIFLRVLYSRTFITYMSS